MENLTAKDIMTTDVFCVPDNWPISEVVRAFSERKISGAPVVDARSTMVGVVSWKDLVQEDGYQAAFGDSEHLADYYQRTWEKPLNSSEFREQTLNADGDQPVSAVMTPAVFSIHENASIGEIARTMLSGRIHRLMVIGAEDELLGIVSSMDMLKAISEMT